MIEGTKIQSLNLISILMVLSLMLLNFSCNETYTPRPKGFFRIELPEKDYHVYDGGDCPFRFEIPSYAVVENYRDTLREPCWKHIRFPQFNGEIFLSYKKVNGDVEAFIEDSRGLAYKHTVKADAIDETLLNVPGKLYGIIYDIGGSAASSVQFFATDSTHHFLRGALYFNVPPEPDSLAPVINFLRKDIERLMTTLEWK